MHAFGRNISRIDEDGQADDVVLVLLARHAGPARRRYHLLAASAWPGSNFFSFFLSLLAGGWVVRFFSPLERREMKGRLCCCCLRRDGSLMRISDTFYFSPRRFLLEVIFTIHVHYVLFLLIVNENDGIDIFHLETEMAFLSWIDVQLSWLLINSVLTITFLFSVWRQHFCCDWPIQTCQRKRERNITLS